MSKFITEYLPEISYPIQKLIRSNVTYSMISYDETSYQYEINQCLELFQEYGDVYKKEIKYLSKLMSEGVSFLEF